MRRLLVALLLGGSGCMDCGEWLGEDPDPVTLRVRPLAPSDISRVASDWDLARIEREFGPAERTSPSTLRYPKKDAPGADYLFLLDAGRPSEIRLRPSPTAAATVVWKRPT